MSPRSLRSWSSSQPGHVRYGEAAGRWVLAATVLGSGHGLLDGTVVNVALPQHRRATSTRASPACSGPSTPTPLTLAALILLGGSLGDRFGRRRVFLIGVVWFALASLLCGAGAQRRRADRRPGAAGHRRRAADPRAAWRSSRRPSAREDRARAIGAWSGLGGDRRGDRAVPRRLARADGRLALGLPDQPAARGRGRARRRAARAGDPRPRTRRPASTCSAPLLGALALGGDDLRPHRARRARPAPSWSAPPSAASSALVAFVRRRAARRAPDAAAGHLRRPPFSAANVVTLLVYGALGGGSSSWCGPAGRGRLLRRSRPARAAAGDGADAAAVRPRRARWPPGSGRGSR